VKRKGLIPSLQEPASLTNYFYNFPPKKNEINKAFCCVSMKMFSVTVQSYRSFSSSEVYIYMLHCVSDI